MNRNCLAFRFFNVVSFVYNSWCSTVNSVGPPSRLPRSLPSPRVTHLGETRHSRICIGQNGRSRFGESLGRFGFIVLRCFGVSLRRVEGSALHYQEMEQCGSDSLSVRMTSSSTSVPRRSSSRRLGHAVSCWTPSTVTPVSERPKTTRCCIRII